MGATTLMNDKVPGSDKQTSASQQEPPAKPVQKSPALVTGTILLKDKNSTGQAPQKPKTMRLNDRGNKLLLLDELPWKKLRSASSLV